VRPTPATLALLTLLPPACAADPGDALKSGAGEALPPITVSEASNGMDDLGLDGSSAPQADEAMGETPAPSDDASQSIDGQLPVTADSLEATTSSDTPVTGQGPADGESCPTCTIELQYMTTTTADMTQDIRPHFEIDNSGPSSQSLTELTVRYYFTADGSQQQTYVCDYAQIGCDLIQGSFVAISPATTNADHYLELSFTGGTIPAGGDTGEIQVRFHDSNYQGMFTQTNDYSFGATATQYADWNRVTVYREGTLVWGVEPP
jgi:cellulose 1,4-beta-cellobiosidase